MEEDDLHLVFPSPPLQRPIEEFTEEPVKVLNPVKPDSPLLNMGIIGEETTLLSLDSVEYTLYVILKNGREIEYPISVSKIDEEKHLKEYSTYIKSMIQGRLRGVVVSTADGRLAFINGEAVAILELK